MRLLLCLCLALLPAIALAATMDMGLRPPPPPDLPEHLRVTPETPLEQMRDALDAALAQRPDDAGMLHRRGTVRYHLGDEAGAMEDWAQAAALDPVHPPADLLADIESVFRLQGEGDAAAASSRLAEVAAAHDANPYFHLLRAEQAMRAQAYDMAEAAYRRAIELDPDLFVPQLSLARYLEYRGDQNGARAAYETAAALAPSHPLPWDFLGQHQFATGETEAARASLRRAAEADAAWPVAEMRLAQLHAAAGDLIGARHWYRLARNADGADAYALALGLGDAEMRLGLMAEAGASFEAAIALRPTAAALLARGYVAEAMGDEDTAIAQYRRAVTVDPGNLVASNNLAMALIRAGRNPEEARAHAAYVRERLPDNATVLGTYALANALVTEDDAARALLREATRADPRDPWLRFALGRMQMAAGEQAAARMNLEATLILAPAFPHRAEVESLLAGP
jgi:tetratricopeptide (TPR) repeat protein